MEVQVKEGCTGFYGGKLRKEGEKFTIEAGKHSVTGQEITPEDQFSERWMERLCKPRRQGRPKKEEIKADMD